MSGKLTLATILTVLIASVVSCSLSVLPPSGTPDEVYTATSTPENLSASVDYSARTVNLTWDETEGASYYNVYFQTEVGKNTDSGQQVQRVTTSSLSIPLDRLEADQIYLFQVSAAGSSNSSESEKTAEAAVSTLSGFTFTPPSQGNFVFTVNASGTKYQQKAIVEPTFTIELFSDSSMTTVAADPNGNSFSMLHLSAPVANYDTNFSLRSNTTYYFRVVMYVGGVEVSRNEGNFSTFTSNIAPGVTSLEAGGNLKGRIELSFSVPVVNPGLEEQVERCFRIERSDLDSPLVMESAADGGISFSDNGDGTLRAVYTDYSVQPGNSYSYTVTSYYHYHEGDLYQAGESASTSFVHPLDIPSIAGQASLEPTDEEKLSYTVSIPVRLNFGLTDASVIDVTVSSAVESGQAVPELTYAGSSTSDTGVTTYSYTFTLTPEQAETTHYYVFSVTHAIGDELSDPVQTTSLATSPTRENAEIFFTDFSASSNLGDGIHLSWSTTDAGRNEDIMWNLYRSESSSVIDEGNLIAVVDDPGQGSYVDASAEAGTTYYYTLMALRAQDQVFTLSSARGGRLPAVSDLSASQAEYADRIVLEWNWNVSDINGFKVYADGEEQEDMVLNSQEGSLWRYEYTDSSDAGEAHSFQVVPVDSQGSAGVMSNTAQGSMLGPHGLDVAATYNTYGDRIEVTWKDRLGADQYRVSVYTDLSGEPVTTERVPVGEGSYVFRYDDPVFSNEDVVIDYPLSREYYFTVAPMHLASTGEDCEPVTGSWVQPPRGIRASKAEFSNQIRIDWEQNMADARYRVFRRQAGSDVWTDISVVYTGSRAFVTYSESEGSTMYEYSVASELNGVIGPVQNQFDSDEANTGYPLFKPSRVAVIQPEEATNVDSELFEIELDVTPGATGYQVSSSSYSSPLVFDFSSASTTGSEGQAGYGYIDEKTSKVHLYVPRPRIQFREYFDFTLNSLKDDSVISYATDVTLVPMFYYQVEALNLAFSVLSDALHEVDEAFGNDWWEFTLAGTGKPVRYYGEEGISRVYAYSCPASNGEWTISRPASVQLNSYTSNSISLSGQFGVYPYKNMGSYVDDNSVEELTADPDGLNSLDITLPYGIGTAHVVFNNANVNDNSGTYTVSIDFNRDGSYEGNEVVTVPYGDTYVEPF